MRPIAPLLAITAAAALFGAGCGGSAADAGGDEAAPAAVAVEVKTFQFAPDPLEIEAGQTVEWTNSDATVHTVVSEELDGSLDQGDSYSHTFAEPGTYKYLCDRHSGPGMRAVVVVR